MAQKVASGVYKGVTTSELDELAAETAASMTSKHPDYAQVRRTRPSPALSGSVWHDKTSAFRGSTLSSRMLLFPNVRDADRPALTSPIPPPRSSPPASRSPTCTRTPRSPSPRRTSLARAHAARFRPHSRPFPTREFSKRRIRGCLCRAVLKMRPERSAPTRAPASSTRIPRPEGSDRLATPDADRRLTSATKKTAA